MYFPVTLLSNHDMAHNSPSRQQTYRSCAMWFSNSGLGPPRELQDSFRGGQMAVKSIIIYCGKQRQALKNMQTTAGLKKFNSQLTNG